MPCMKFLFVRPDVCRRLPSDSTSRWTPLPWAMRFPLLGLARDLHPLANAHAERTTITKQPRPQKAVWLFLYSLDLTDFVFNPNRKNRFIVGVICKYMLKITLKIENNHQNTCSILSNNLPLQCTIMVVHYNMITITVH